MLLNLNWMITNLSDSFHYQPKKIDDAFAKAVFINFIELLDQNKIYFTQEEISDLEKSCTNIDDEIKNQKNDFLEKMKNVKEEIRMVKGRLDEKAESIDEVISLLQYIDTLKRTDNKVKDI